MFSNYINIYWQQSWHLYFPIINTPQKEDSLETEMWGILSWGPTETAINETVLKMSCKSDFILRFRHEDKVLKGKIFIKGL